MVPCPCLRLLCIACLRDSGIVDVKVISPKAEPKGAQGLIGSVPGPQSAIIKPAGSDNGSFQANYDIGFEGAGAPLVNKSPVHESIVIAAFIQSKKPLPKGTTYHNLNNKQWEYFRGLVWNDDPSCYLFDDYSKENHNFSTGYQWYMDFKYGDPGCMIQRSHYGDLQFLHAMGAVDSEEPKETRRKMLEWLKVIYKLACGNQGVSEQDQLKQHLGEWFNDKTKPSDHSTLRDLLVASTPSYSQTDIQWRALGLSLHIISDSYAVGHTQRRLKNPDAYQGRDKKGYMTFKPGTYGDWGAIIVFHCYGGQDSDRHSYYDGLEGAPLPVPKNLNSFNSIIGARNAIEACKKLINYFADGTKWEDGVQTFLETEVFPIDKDARPSNSQVDEAGPVSFLVHQIAGVTSDSEYRAEFQRKLASLETGASTTPGLATMGRRSIWRYIIFTVSLFVLAIHFTFVGIQVRGLMH
jgi:hypothetical protein